MEAFREIKTAPLDGRLLIIAWTERGSLYQTFSRWLGEDWEGGWEPTHWKPAPKVHATCGRHEVSPRMVG